MGMHAHSAVIYHFTATNNLEVTRVTFPVDKFHIYIARCNLTKSGETS